MGSEKSFPINVPPKAKEVLESGVVKSIKDTTGVKELLLLC